MVSEAKRNLIILFLAGVFFLVSTQVLSFISSVFSSPDETANAFFAETFSAQGRLYSFESLNTVLGDFFYPRAMVAIDGRVFPIGFLGLPLFFGVLIKIFGFWSETLWTPFLAFLATSAWYAIWSKFLGRRVGLFTALLLLATPAWWFWASRPLMPNVLFVSFLIFAAYFLSNRPWFRSVPTNPWGDYLLSGFLVGVALWVRTSEIFWLGPLFIFMWLWHRKKVSFSSLSAFVIGLIVTVLPLLFVNHSMYGDYFVTGYTVASPNFVTFSTPVQSNGEVVQPWYLIARDYLSAYLPFGLHPRAILYNVWHYGLLMYWWMIIPALIGTVMVWRRKNKRAQNFVPLLGLFFVAAFLAIVYGSSAIHDNPDLSAITIGNSYSRYWLPLFVAITPLTAVALVKLGEKTKNFVSVILLLLITGLSFNIVFLSTDDALWPTRNRLIEAEVIREEVLGLTENNAVIVTERGDKLLFPDRVIRYALRDETTYNLLPKIIEVAPVYYYGLTLPQTDLDYLNNEKLKGLGLEINLVRTFDAESLYKFSRLP